MHDLVEQYKKDTPDICEHLDTLTHYASKCDHVTEMGFRHGASFSALLKGQPKKLITYDLGISKAHADELDRHKGITETVYIEGDTLKVDIEETDLLFIDTLHTYDQLKKELERHAGKVRKYLIFHDTEAYRYKGEDGSPYGLMDVICEYVRDNPAWEIEEHYFNNNGLTVLVKND